jgi:hypothetical protein
MHSAVGGPEGEGGEFLIFGRARPVEDPATRELATELSSYEPEDQYVLFELGIESALLVTYEDERVVRRRWHQA